MEEGVLWLQHRYFVMMLLAISNGLGVFRSLCDEASALRRSPGIVLLIWLFSGGIGVPLNSPCGVDLHRTKYQLCVKAGSAAAERGGDHLVYGAAEQSPCSSTF